MYRIRLTSIEYNSDLLISYGGYFESDNSASWARDTGLPDDTVTCVWYKTSGAEAYIPTSIVDADNIMTGTLLNYMPPSIIKSTPISDVEIHLPKSYAYGITNDPDTGYNILTDITSTYGSGYTNITVPTNGLTGDATKIYLTHVTEVNINSTHFVNKLLQFSLHCNVIGAIDDTNADPYTFSNNPFTTTQHESGTILTTTNAPVTATWLISPLVQNNIFNQDDIELPFILPIHSYNKATGDEVKVTVDFTNKHTKVDTTLLTDDINLIVPAWVLGQGFIWNDIFVNNSSGSSALDANADNIADYAAVLTDGATAYTPNDITPALTHAAITNGNPHGITAALLGLNNVQNIKNNFSATIDPTPTDDINSGYSTGSRWINNTAGTVWECVNPTASNAVWHQLDAAGTGGSSPSAHIETITDTKTLTVGTDAEYQIITPSGGSRAIFISVTNATAGSRFKIKHNGASSATETLNIYQTDGGTLLDIISAGSIVNYVFDGTNWVAFSLGTGANNNQNSFNTRIGTRAFATNWAVAIGPYSHADSGIAIGYNTITTGSGVSIGDNAQTDTNGISIGINSNGTTRGISIGYQADGSNHGVAVGGYNTHGGGYGVAIGENAWGSTSGVGIGNSASGQNKGIAIGSSARGRSNGVGIGYGAHGSYNGLSIGYYAGQQFEYSGFPQPNKNVLLGYYAGYGLTMPLDWQANHAYILDDIIKFVGVDYSFCLKCIVAGTSGGSQPVPGSTNLGDTFTDNTVTWEVVNAYGNNNIIIGYDIQVDTTTGDQLNIGNLLKGDLQAKRFYPDAALELKNHSISIMYTTNGENILFVDTSTNVCDITLSTKDCKAGRPITIVDISGNAATNNITLMGENSELIGGAATLVINTNYSKTTLYATGTAWI